jgi:hypothetical protein
MSTGLSKICKRGFARFLVVYLSLGLAAPVTPLLAAPGDIVNNSGVIPLEQAFFAFEVEGPIGTLKEVPTWDEIEQVLDNPYAFVLDNVDTTIYPNGAFGTWTDLATGRAVVDPGTGAFTAAGTGNDQGWPSYRLTQERRRVVLYRDAANLPCTPGTAGCTEVLRSNLYRLNGDTSALGVPCAPGSAGCVEVPLPRHLYHPLNYNYQGGEELRLLNPEFAETDFEVPGDLLAADPPETMDCNNDGILRPVYRYTPRPITVSAGIERLEDDEAAIDYNSPIRPDADTFGGEVCVRTVEVVFSPGPGPRMGGEFGIVQTTIPEGICLCGGDPGEPGYAGFGVLLGDISTQYSTPTVPGKFTPGSTLNPDGTRTIVPADILTSADRLYDPSRGFIEPMDPVTGEFGLRKPSLRKADFGGTPAAPNYLYNSQENLVATAEDEGDVAANAQAFLAPSSENDYIRNREAASILGKAIFWDQQLGSDSVQSCGSCHFHAGVDNRTKNQLNPNHLGGDFTFQLKGPNQEVTPADFPFRKLADVEIAGDPACLLPLVTPFGQVVCDASNVVSDTNDVMSSMGVFFGTFGDIPPIGTFLPAVNGVASVPPDIRTDTPLTWRQQIDAAVTLTRSDLGGLNAGNLDPIPAFQGVRRVEPRNTPTIFGAAMNFDNFWDGRARHDFNGGSVFGPADPQAHVWVFDNVSNSLVPTRQIIRFVSLASLFTGPGLSNFEMSQTGRNWAKVGKKLLQAGVTPLANQFVDNTDSVLGPYSNQNGAACASLPPEDRSGNGSTVIGTGTPGLCISYPALIRNAYYPALWQNDGAQHINGATSGCTKPMVNGVRDPVDPPNCDPFDGYVLSGPFAGAVVPTDTSQFTQMEANVPLFFGLGVQAWASILIPDDSPMDRFFDSNPDSFKTFGEAGEPFLVLDLVNCDFPGAENPVTVQSCFTEVGRFKRDSAAASPVLNAQLNCSTENCNNPDAFQVASHGTRAPGDPDPLMGLDFFLGSNMSLKNPRFKTLRCGECHAGGTLTDHTFEISHQMTFGDWIPEFVTVGQELFPEPLTRGRLVHPFSLEGELQENAQDAIERNIVDFELDEMGFPRGHALLDNGMYNIGIRPIHEDVGRGGPDAFGWPLSLGYLALKNLGGADYSPGGDNPADGFALPQFPGNPLPNWEPVPWVLDNNGLVVNFDGTNAGLSNCDPTMLAELTDGDPLPNCNLQTGLQGDMTGGGLMAPTGQDFQINPGFAEEPVDPQLPPYLAKWASNISVGDETQIDEVFIGLNTLLREPIQEGFVDTWGPFNPAATISEVMNNSRQVEMGTWPNVNRVHAQGAFKAAPLRNVELMGPYFHTGSKLTLRQELDFYDRGGDFPISSSAHRDFLIMHLDIEDEALGGYIDPATGVPLPRGTVGAVPEFTEEQKEAIKVSIIDFLLELTDERVAFERAPFDHPEVIVPLDGTAPENHLGRTAMAADPRYRVVPASGAAGIATRLPNFLEVASGPRCTPKAAIGTGSPVIGSTIPQCDPAAISQYSSNTTGAAAPAGPAKFLKPGMNVTYTGGATGRSVTSGAPQQQVLASNTGIIYSAPSAPSAAEVILNSEPSSLQSAGSTVMLTAAANGGSGTYQYQYWLHNGTDWALLQDYGTQATCKWTPSEAGTYTVQVHARNAGSEAEYEAWTRTEYVIR